MTLSDLWLLARKYWGLLAAITVVISVLSVVYGLISHEEGYEASAYIVAGEYEDSVSGAAEAAARQIRQELSGEDLTCAVSRENKNATVTITVSGPSSEKCIQYANAIANSADSLAETMYADYQNKYHGEVSLADSAGRISLTKTLVKYLIMGFFGGIIVAFLVVILIYTKKRSVRTVQDIEAATGLPVLDAISSNNGDRLLANLLFSTKGEPAGISNVLLLPVSNKGAAESVGEALQSAMRERDLVGRVDAVDSLDATISGAYEAQKASAVIVVACQWVDSIPRLEACVSELRFAGAPLSGVAFVKQEHEKL